jgi:hypothetical protein
MDKGLWRGVTRSPYEVGHGACHRNTDKLSSFAAICARKPIGFSRILFDKAGDGKTYGLKLAQQMRMERLISTERSKAGLAKFT